MDEKKRKELMDEHKAIMSAASKIMKRAEEEGRGYTPAEEVEWNKLMQRDGEIYDELHPSTRKQVFVSENKELPAIPIELFMKSVGDMVNSVLTGYYQRLTK